MGQELYALVKSSSILLLTDNKVKTTAQSAVGRNQPHCRWPGQRRSHPGDARRQIAAAMVTRQPGTAGAGVGGKVCAVFKASAVILCTYQ